MVTDILKATGLPFRESRFLSPPNSTYAIYSDSLDRRGADTINLLTQHDITIEVYEYSPDKNAEKSIEDELDRRSIEYTKMPRFFIQEEQLYQVVYDFTYFSKGGQEYV